MNYSEKNIRSDFIQALVKRFGEERTALLPILQEIQKKF